MLGPTTRAKVRQQQHLVSTSAQSTSRRSSTNENLSTLSTTSRSKRVQIPPLPRRTSINSTTPTLVAPSRSSRIQTPTVTSQQAIIDQLLTRVTSLEGITTSLVSRIDTLSETISSLKETVVEQRKVIETFEETTKASSNGVSVEQERINNNIVIRGLEIEEGTTESALLTTFTNICTHIGIPVTEELRPVSASLLESKSKAGGPLIVKLSSRVAKQKFLQARRVKRDIRPLEIGQTQGSNRPLVITEQLTSENQKLLFEARSLRGPDKYKFIWSNNGHILARRKKRSPVIRIKDILDVERLRAHLEPDRHVTGGRTWPTRPNRTQE